MAAYRRTRRPSQAGARGDVGGAPAAGRPADVFSRLSRSSVSDVTPIENARSLFGARVGATPPRCAIERVGRERSRTCALCCACALTVDAALLPRRRPWRQRGPPFARAPHLAKRARCVRRAVCVVACVCCSKTDFARSPLELPVDTAAVVDAVLFNVRCPAVSGGGACLGRVLCGPCVRIWPSRCCCQRRGVCVVGDCGVGRAALLRRAPSLLETCWGSTRPLCSQPAWAPRRH